MTSPATRAAARSYGGERALTMTTGLLLLLLGVGAALLGYGVFGQDRATRPVLDPEVLRTLVDWQLAARVGAIVLGLLLLVLGLRIVFATLRPEHHPDLALNPTRGHGVLVTATAITEAIATDAEQVPGVSKARATMVGDEDEPALRLSLWLEDGTDVKQVWREVDDTVLRQARESLGVDHLPTAVRLELNTAERQRVR
ncbi:alkaline shock response membrane anchor protein AmaP [Actinokineospora xionganensis]|uniref:Alkaline shock response membrane anchor protein AmaP n=1 Tax=Actinokineospora xionganensis TaxID=2684470 RepID=A0ABR7LB28_9PSEU|nr:alkaline shock response membrane anchor protein AmaP [Actinokineospora xionganensis]MBC6449497.1 alkaline shock response membrane anchor protein AmaP [Actinokineospora xionganensis]